MSLRQRQCSASGATDRRRRCTGQTRCFVQCFPRQWFSQRPLFKFVISTTSPSTTVKLQKTGRILVTRKLDDFAILVTASSSGAQAQVAVRIHNRDSPARGSSRRGIVRAKAMAGIESKSMDLIALFMTKVLLLPDSEPRDRKRKRRFAQDSAACTV